jgi:hypothetical protein
MQAAELATERVTQSSSYLDIPCPNPSTCYTKYLSHNFEKYGIIINSVLERSFNALLL